MRKAVKVFLCLWWQEDYRNVFKAEPPLPWALAHGGHTDLVTLEQVLEWEARENAPKEELAKGTMIAEKTTAAK